MFESRDYLDNNLNNILKNPKYLEYFNYLIEVNNVTNLTRITDIDSVYYKHFYDSLILLNYTDLQDKTLLDVGAGAGFPSIPLKIADESLKVTIIDSLNKRINFLTELTKKLNLNNVNLIHGRAEDLNQKNFYDLVTSRAVARLNVLVELTLPFVKKGGYFIAYKAINYQEELNESLSGISILGGKLDKVVEYQISQDEKRVLIFIKKIKETKDIYPRHFSKIKKSPL
jgi:16S rRNA (guanine527-N7)-methyltransferase